VGGGTVLPMLFAIFDVALVVLLAVFFPPLSPCGESFLRFFYLPPASSTLSALPCAIKGISRANEK
jgi:hypothetical protein